MGICDKLAADLRALANEARRLPPPNRRNPEAFHEARDELAQRIVEVAQILAGNITIGRTAPHPPIREGRVVARGKVIEVEFRNRQR